jgi:hypothetical protein
MVRALVNAMLATWVGDGRRSCCAHENYIYIYIYIEREREREREREKERP